MRTLKDILDEIQELSKQIEKDCEDLKKPFSGMLDTEVEE